MKTYAVLCTRDRSQVTRTTDKLVKFYVKCGIQVVLMAGQESIFTAYSNALNQINASDDDQIIFCHDDLEIRNTPEEFMKKLNSELSEEGVGFIGPAGTTVLTPDAVWWDHNMWKSGYHRGRVVHLDPQGQEYNTDYGPEGQVVVLDGLFLAAKVGVVRKVGLKKPEYFQGDWDFYDIHYTAKAHELGYKNKAFYMRILHHSRGELVGRDSWHKNREAFIRNTELPLSV